MLLVSTEGDSQGAPVHMNTVTLCSTHKTQPYPPNILSNKQLGHSFIAERERANLVVQLARFFYIYNYIYLSVCRHTVMFYIILNTLALYSCSQLCMLLACIYINNLYCNHQVLAQLLHHFLLYIFCCTFVARSPTMFNILLV